MKNRFEEELSHSNLDDSTKKKLKKEILDSLKEKKLKDKWKKELEDNPIIQAYFSRYSKQSVENFKKSYLDYKYRANYWKKLYSEESNRIRTQWIENAHQHLEIILQKKLFDLQCLWRANQIKLEGIEVCFDFTYWEKDILNCPFVEINPDDIEMYQEFLRSGNLDSDKIFYEWQDYDQYREKEADLPEWYEYHNLRTGNQNLYVLPNLKGEKEEFYRFLYFEEKEKLTPSNSDFEPQKLYLSFYDEWMNFANEFEDEHQKIILQNMNEFDETHEDNECYEQVFRKMIELNIPIPIESHNDFREALWKAYYNYFFEKIAEQLPLAFEQYQFTKSMNLKSSPHHDLDFYQDLCKTFREQILRGRYLNGEPQDFNF